MILPALQGLSEGFSKTFGQISEDKRKNKSENDRLVAESLKQRADNDATLTPDEHDNLYRQYYKTLHPELKSSELEQLIGTHQYIRGQMAQNIPQPPAQGGNTPTGMNDIPSGPSGLPSMPQAPITMGQGRFNEAQPRTLQSEQAKFGAQRQAEMQGREDLATFNEKKIQEIQGRTDINDDQKEQLLQSYGVKPIRKGGTGAATTLPGTTGGSQLRSALKAQGLADDDPRVSALNDSSSYKVIMAPDKKSIIHEIETERQTRGGPAALGSSWKKMFPVDMAGNPTSDDAMYVSVRSVNGGAPVGIYPETKLGSEESKNVIKIVPTKDGGYQALPVNETSIRNPTAGGQPISQGGASVAPPIPTAPGERPTPGQPKPRMTTPSGASVGAGREIPGAGKAFTPEQKQKNEQIAEQLNNTIGTIKDLQRPEELAVLGNLMSTGKIRLQVDPQQGFWTSVLNQNVPLTEQEKNVAANWQLLSEGVLQMRIPMGGAGFRGPEGFGAIESNRGVLGQNPDIIRKVLKGTLREFRAQRDPLVKNAGTYGYDVKPEMEHGSAVADTNSDVIKVQIPGQAPGYIHSSQKDAFFQKYKDAKVIP
jgi:hypothetical protein